MLQGLGYRMQGLSYPVNMSWSRSGFLRTARHFRRTLLQFQVHGPRLRIYGLGYRYRGSLVVIWGQRALVFSFKVWGLGIQLKV